MTATENLIADAAAVLVKDAVDLGNERAVIRALQSEGYEAGEILGMLDGVIDKARAIRAVELMR
jgi:hypothetical protein